MISSVFLLRAVRSRSAYALRGVTLEPVPDDLLPVRSRPPSLLGCRPTSAPPRGRCAPSKSCRTGPAATADELAARLGVTERAARRYVGDPPRGRHPGRVGPRPARRVPARARHPAAPGRLHRGRGAGPGDGGARRPAGSRRRRRPRRRRARQGDPGAAGERRPAGGGAAGARVGRAGPVPGPPGSRHHQRARRRRRGPPRRAGRRTAASPAGEWEAEVDPWAVVVRYGRWYLLCHSHRADAIRTYRIDRVRAVRADRARVRAARRPRPGGRAGGEPRRRLGVPDPRRVRRAAGRGGPVDPAADGAARTVGRRLRARRQHQQSGDVRAGVAGERAVRVPRRGRAGTARRGRHGRGAFRRRPRRTARDPRCGCGFGMLGTWRLCTRLPAAVRVCSDWRTPGTTG